MARNAVTSASRCAAIAVNIGKSAESAAWRTTEAEIANTCITGNRLKGAELGGAYTPAGQSNESSVDGQARLFANQLQHLRIKT